MSQGCRELCKAACCQDIKIQLSKSEYEALLAKGAVLWGTFDEDMYKMVGRCPNLLPDNSCAVHGTKEQPWICKAYPFLGEGCRARRRERPDLIQVLLPEEQKFGQVTLAQELFLEAMFVVAGVRHKW